MKKLYYSQIREVQDTIEKSGMQGHYVLGAYEVMLANIIADLPKHKQMEAIRTFESLALRVKSIDSGY